MTTIDPMQVAQLCAANPDWALEQLDKVDARENLVAFAALMWHVIEPVKPFIRGWAIDAIAEHLVAVTEGQIRKLWIQIPPGMSKSLFVDVFWPAWEWGPRNLPSNRFIAWSYSDAITVRDNLKFRSIVTSDKYRRLWGDRFQLSIEQNQKMRIANDKTGFKIASSIFGLGTGERANRLVIDDGNAPKDVESEVKRGNANRWLCESMPSRAIDDQSAIVGIAQRTHEDDMGGVVLSKKELGFEVLCLPMRYESDHPHARVTSIGFKDPRTKDGELLFPERFSEDYLTNDLEPFLSALGGDYAVSCQLQQRPIPRGGGMFKHEWFKFVDEVPSGGVEVRGWDLAGSTRKSSPFTVGVKMKMVDGRIYVVDVRRGRWEVAEVRHQLYACAEFDGVKCCQDIPQDPGQAGLAQKADLGRHLMGFHLSFSPESGDKEVRAQGFASSAQSGNVYLVRAPWNDPYVAEAAVFSKNAKYKDQIDASSRAYARLLALAKVTRTLPARPRFYSAATADDE